MGRWPSGIASLRRLFLEQSPFLDPELVDTIACATEYRKAARNDRDGHAPIVQGESEFGQEIAGAEMSGWK